MSDKIKMGPEVQQAIDRLVMASQDDGWDAALDAARVLLPVECGQLLVTLYRRTAARSTSALPRPQR